jgi:hypothetical protein
MNNPSESDRLDEFNIDNATLTIRPRECESVTLQLPKTVLISLRTVIEKRSMSSVKALIRFYIGRGLRQDLSQLFAEKMTERIMDTTAQVLARHLGSDAEVAAVMKEIRQAAIDRPEQD